VTISSKTIAGGVAAGAAIALVAFLFRKKDVTADRARASRTVTIRRDAAEVQRTFRDTDLLPQFFRGLESIETLGDGRQRWIFAGKAHRSMAVDIEVVDDVEGQRFEWKTAPSAPFSGGGSLSVVPAPEGRGVQARLALHVEGPAAKAQAAFHRLFGASPAQIAMESLRSFKALMEAGEIPVSDAVLA
jgi:uncharacterized membrane protein